MTASELYYNFHILINQNNEQKNLNVEKANFVAMYNRESERFLSDYIERNNSSDNILYINGLINRDVTLQRRTADSNKVVYRTPADMFFMIHRSLISTVNTGSCTGIVYNHLFKPEEANARLEDAFTKPSFAWERGLAKLEQDQIVVYQDGFTIENTTMSYYRKPVKIDLEGYINFQGVKSSNIDPDTPDYISHQILDKMAKEYMGQIENQIGYQISSARERQY